MKNLFHKSFNSCLLAAGLLVVVQSSLAAFKPDTKFFSKTVDVQCEFFKNSAGAVERIEFSIGEGRTVGKKIE